FRSFISPNTPNYPACLIAQTTAQNLSYTFFCSICIIDNGLKRGSRPSHDKKLRREFHMKVKTLVTNGLLAALYIAVSALIAPFGFTNIQFRLSELFNHFIVFNKKYFIGIILGVFLANLFI